MSTIQHRLEDDQARDRAQRHLAAVAGIGFLPPVTWDPVHHLQGHVVIGGRHVVVIAPRDDVHVPLVLSASEWDELRRGRHSVGHLSVA